MNEVENKNLPWKYFPEKFIRFANQFKYSNDEFERIIGYLILDVGVETLFKVYVLMTNSDTIKYPEREAIAQGTMGKDKIPDSRTTIADFDTANFHKLVETVKRLSDSKIGDEDIKKAEYFHKLRNNIYHQGVKSAPPKKDFEEYLQLAERLLATLLNTDKPTKETLTDEEWDDLMYEIELSSMSYWMKVHMQEEFQDLQSNIAIALEAFGPKYTSRRFEKSLKAIRRSFPDNEDDEVSTRYEYQMQRIASFKELLVNEEDNITFIDKVLNDITYLHLDILLSRNVVDDNDIKNYLEYRKYVERFHDHPDDASRDEREKLLQLQDWARKTEEKLNTLTPKQKPDSQKEEDL